jgi:hypothetical protein
VVPNTSAENLAKNRRVEIKLANRDRAKRRPAEPAIMRNSAQHRDSITSKNITLRGKQVKKRRFPWFVQEFEGYGVEPNIWTISNASRGP